jgi:integrase
MSRGTIRPHGDGKWRIQAYAGADPVTGKDRRVSKVVAGSRKDAERALTALLGEVDGGRHNTNGERTFGQCIDAYLAHKTLSLEATSVDNYGWQAGYIPDRLRNMPVAKVEVDHLEALYAHLAAKGKKRDGTGLSAKSIQNIHAVVHGVFELARRRKWVVVNPAVDAEPPAVRRRVPSPAPADGIARLFVAAAREHKALPAYLRLSVAVGGRRSEIHGLRWSGVDFARGRVTLRDTVVRGGGEWIVKPRTKTGEQRIVGVDAGTIEALRGVHAAALDLALECGTTVASNGFVFSDAVGGTVPWKPTTTAARFSRACKSSGLPPEVRLHDLRHFMATWLINEGVPIPVVSARLGHAQNSTTLDIYTGRVAASDATAAEIMGRFLDGDPS